MYATRLHVFFFVYYPQLKTTKKCRSIVTEKKMFSSNVTFLMYSDILRVVTLWIGIFLTFYFFDNDLGKKEERAF